MLTCVAENIPPQAHTRDKRERLAAWLLYERDEGYPLPPLHPTPPAHGETVKLWTIWKIRAIFQM
jgi:hypothetical protein